ncbi:hypothetical protein BpHYR1_033932 [Brachionus plicatilis]|uniref:Uncharacterized protein n=1 Tax=Brachionus plicatilis TaxID=10195 RepID=A0A3M7P4V0_BRAPC|nr:hypothetical protein BpHYR1_033932 [Brachionus plicatilis]
MDTWCTCRATRG